MATLNSSGKNSSSDNQDKMPWEKLEDGSVAWGDFSDRDQEDIVKHFAPKIRFLALRLKAKVPKNVEIGELISAGTLGLIEALRKFQPQLEIRFETYAENRIRGAMLDELRKLDWVPRSLRQRMRQIDGIIQEFEHSKGRAPSEEELQEVTGLELKEIRLGMEALQNQMNLSLDVIQDTLALEKEGHDGEPYSTTATQEIVDKISSLVDGLTPREQLVLSLYYGDEMNMRETAEILGITEGRVSQLHSQALNRLKKEFTNQFGDISQSL
ncbi:MAG: FliA/WhiG family RNA polymerase sigma factor [Desulfovibrionaceae bacterium]